LSIYTIISDTFWLRILHADIAGLDSIGKVVTEAGSAARKTRSDTLWLPLQKNEKIYGSDLISTEKDSIIVLELNSKLQLTVEPKSFVRIRWVDGHPLIRLAKGEIKTNFAQDEVLWIKKGSKVENVLIRKGTYFIKNDLTQGIQITSYTQDVKVSAGVGDRSSSTTKAHLKEESNLTPEKDDEKDAPAEAAGTEKDEPLTDIASLDPAQEQVFDLPTPEDRTIFLIKSTQTIVIGAKAICPDLCTLRIFKDQKEFLVKQLNTNEKGTYQLASSQIIPGEYSWNFSSKTFEHAATFSIREFSESSLSNAIETGRPIEVLGQ
jgi:hypothetical protein